MLKRFITLLTVSILLISSSITAMAAEPGKNLGSNRGYIRAKLTYEFDDGVEGLSDNIINFADGWSKTGEWFYYKEPVSPGDKVRFITGFKVPAYWTEDLQNKNFKVVVTVEASEVAPGDSGWFQNTKILYSKNYDLWSMGYEHNEDVVIREGKLDVKINEYQLNENGKEVPYVNNKIIVPGQPISKIVEFELAGSLGSNTLMEKVIEVIKTGQNTFLLCGTIGLSLMSVGGYLFYKKQKGGAR